jgi:hypothetical protein
LPAISGILKLWFRKENTFQIKLECKRQFGRHKPRREENIKMYLKNRVREVMAGFVWHRICESGRSRVGDRLLTVVELGFVRKMKFCIQINDSFTRNLFS